MAFIYKTPHQSLARGVDIVIVDKTPFSVLDLPPDTDVQVARSRYRQLAREHHPDSAPGADKAAATRVMAGLNWAIEEIERDPVRWRVDSEGPRAASVSVTPTLVLLSRENHFTGYVTAAAPGVDGAEVRLRYAPGLISAERLPSFGGVANFRIRLAEGVHEQAAAVRERLEVRAPRCEPVEVSVAIEPFSAEDAPLLAADEAPSGRVWLHPALAGAIAAFGVLSALLLLA